MTVQLWIEGDGALDELMSLYDYLRRNPVLRPLVRYQSGSSATGTLGTVDAFILAAVGSGGALTALAASLNGFFARPRRSSSDIHLTVQKGDFKLELDAKRVSDTAAVVEDFKRLMDGGE